VLINGLDLHVVDQGQGDGTPLLLVHGFTGSDVDWADVQPALAAHRRVVSYTHRGHGDSAHAPAYSFDALVSDLEAVADALGLARMHLLGHSMGGIVALRYAFAHPERVRSLVVMDSEAEPAASTSWIDAVAAKAEAEGMAAVWEVMQPFLVGADPTIRARVEHKITHMHTAAFVTLGRELGAYPSMVARLPDLAAIPVTVLVGANDIALVPAAHVMHEAIPGSTLAVIADAGHSPQEERPDEWLRVVTEHLARAET
jgi:pimeloyl-ACP methyl ester carboxylesterase